MTLTKLNAAGNFDTWENEKLNEIKKQNFADAVGIQLYENDEIKLWEINLKPNERIPLSRHSKNYSCTSLTDNLLISCNTNGQFRVIRLHKSDSFYWKCADKEMIHDL